MTIIEGKCRNSIIAITESLPFICLCVMCLSTIYILHTSGLVLSNNWVSLMFLVVCCTLVACCPHITLKDVVIRLVGGAMFAAAICIGYYLRNHEWQINPDLTQFITQTITQTFGLALMLLLFFVGTVVFLLSPGFGKTTAMRLSGGAMFAAAICIVYYLNSHELPTNPDWGQTTTHMLMFSLMVLLFLSGLVTIMFFGHESE